jgi:GntR family transcriptional regulator
MKTSISSTIQEGIRLRIHSGEWEGRIPSEPDLARLFGASRETVRKALGVLEAEGLIYRVHGQGTFVESAVSFNPLSGTLSITEELARSHVPVRNTVLEHGWIGPHDIPSPFLQTFFKDEARVFFLRRLRLVREEVLAVEESCFLEKAFPGVEDCDFTDSLHALMRRRFGLSPDRVQNRFHALDFHRKRDRDTAQLLGSRQALQVERVLARKRSVYYAVGFTLRTDLYPLEFMQLPGRTGGGVL